VANQRPPVEPELPDPVEPEPVEPEPVVPEPAAPPAPGPVVPDRGDVGVAGAGFAGVGLVTEPGLAGVVPVPVPTPPGVEPGTPAAPDPLVVPEPVPRPPAPSAPAPPVRYIDEELVALTPARASSSRTIWRIRISEMPPAGVPIPPAAEPESTPLEPPVPPKPWLSAAEEMRIPTGAAGLLPGLGELPGEPGSLPAPEATELTLLLAPPEAPALDCASAPTPLMPSKSAIAQSFVMCVFIYSIVYFLAGTPHARRRFHRYCPPAAASSPILQRMGCDAFKV